MSDQRGQDERFVVELRPVPPGPDEFGRSPTYRLKLLLKRALRSFGLRCVRLGLKRMGEGDDEAVGEVSE